MVTGYFFQSFSTSAIIFRKDIPSDSCSLYRVFPKKRFRERIFIRSQKHKNSYFLFFLSNPFSSISFNFKKKKEQYCIIYINLLLSRKARKTHFPQKLQFPLEQKKKEKKETPRPSFFSNSTTLSINLLPSILLAYHVTQFRRQRNQQ